MKDWQRGVLLTKQPIASHIHALRFALDDWEPHVPGQYYEVRLPDFEGEYPSRCYSVVSSPHEKGIVELGVELIPEGRFSPRLLELPLGAFAEFRGPWGGHFKLIPEETSPLVLVGGGSGLAPLMSMLRTYTHLPTTRKIIVIASARSLSHLPYHEELLLFAKSLPHLTLAITLTREVPPHWTGYTKRLDQGMLKSILPIRVMPRIYIAGGVSFVDSLRKNLLALGFPLTAIRTEQFIPYSL